MSDPAPAEHRSDVTASDDDAAAIPNAILPHGAMLVLDPLSLEVLQVAGDLAGLLDTSASALLGQPVSRLFQPNQIAVLRSLAAAQDLARPRHLLDPVLRVASNLPLDASLHRSGGMLVLEFERADPADVLAIDPLAGVQEMVDGLETFPTLQGTCQYAADRVRAVSGYDRVLVYRFMPDSTCWVIAESRAPYLEPMLDLRFPVGDLSDQARALYAGTKLRLVTQVERTPAPLTPALNPRTHQPLDLGRAILRDIPPAHRDVLRRMGAGASMSISILRGGRLWGLIAGHHPVPRLLPRPRRAVLELFGSLISLQLLAREQAEALEKRLAAKTLLQDMMLNLASEDDYAGGLTQQSPNLLDYIPCGQAPPDGSRQGGVAVSIGGRLSTLGAVPARTQILALIAWLDTRLAPESASAPGGLFSTDRLSGLWPEAAAFADVASGVLAISISQAAADYIIWFRPELARTARWAGATVTLPAGEYLVPRLSIDAWKDAVRGRGQPWSQTELDAAGDLRVSLRHAVLRRISEAARDRRSAIARDRLLMAELHHRVANTIANIQALVVQTSRSASSLSGFVEGLDGRIQALGKAHGLLSQNRWDGVSIAQLLREALTPLTLLSGGAANVELEGPDVPLTPNAAISFSLAMHELATNAGKFGALSRPGGTVSVTWRVTPDGGVSLAWRERDGPPVEPPARRGFGSVLIDRALVLEAGGVTSISYPPEGVVCDVILPAASIAAPPPAPASRDARVTHAAAPAYPAGPFRILVVEDSALLVMSLEVVFDDLGWEMIGPATRLPEALSLAATAAFDAALLDVNLDGAMVWDVAAVLRGRAIPFVFTTGYDVASILPPDLAGSEVIGKPFHAHDLEQSLRRLIAAARAGHAPDRA